MWIATDRGGTPVAPAVPSCVSRLYPANWTDVLEAGLWVLPRWSTCAVINGVATARVEGGGSCSPNVATVRLVIICNVYVSRDRRLLPRCRLGLRSSTTLTQRRLIVGYRRFGTACRFHRRRSSSLWRWERQADPTSVMKYQPATLNTPLERMAHLRIVSLPCDDYTSFCRVPCFELWYDVTLGILCMV